MGHREARTRIELLGAHNTDAACLCRSSELPAVKSNARYAGSKAATSSAKDIIFASTLSEEAAGHTGKRVHYAQGAYRSAWRSGVLACAPGRQRRAEAESGQSRGCRSRERSGPSSLSHSLPLTPPCALPCAEKDGECPFATDAGASSPSKCVPDWRRSALRAGTVF